MASKKLKDISFAKATNLEFIKTIDNILLHVVESVEKVCPSHFATLFSLVEGWHKYSRKNRKYSRSELLAEYNEDAAIIAGAMSEQLGSSIRMLKIKYKKADTEQKEAIQITMDKLTKISKLIVDLKLAHTNNMSSEKRNSGLFNLLEQLEGYENTDPGLASCYAELQTVSSLLDSLIKDKNSEFEACPVGFTKSQRKEIVAAYNNTLPYINVEIDKGNAIVINYANTVQVIIDQENAILKSKETRKKNSNKDE